MNDTTSKNAMVNNAVIVLGSLVRVCDVDSSWLGRVTQDPSARKLQDAFEQHCSSFIKEHREELRSIIPDQLAQYEEGLVSVQQLMNEAWDARHPA